MKTKNFYISALFVTLLLAGGVSYYASSSPDGLEKVAQDIGFLEQAKEHTNSNSALADYGVKGIDNARLSVGAAGVIGVAATGAISWGLFLLLRRKDAK
jgi:cobalt/nickel transport protein